MSCLLWHWQPVLDPKALLDLLAPLVLPDLKALPVPKALLDLKAPLAPKALLALLLKAVL